MRIKGLVFAGIILPVLAERADAADLTRIKDVSVILNILVFLGALASLTIAIRLFMLVKGGALARGCQFFVISFITLALGQVFVVAEKLQVFNLGFDAAAALYVGTVLLWFAGLMQTRKVLS